MTYPKVREVFAADYSDRVVHHLLINEVEPIFEKQFIYDSFACRKNKGTHKAIIRLKRFINIITSNRKNPAYYLQVDIQSFFPTLDKTVLYNVIKKIIEKTSKQSVWKKEVLWLCCKIIFHNPTLNYHLKSPPTLMKKVPYEKSLFGKSSDKGLPIGNLTSQFFANVYLNELDQFIKKHLKVKYYLRYVDDLLLLSNDIKELAFWRTEIDLFLKTKLKLKLHPKKDKLDSVYNGIDFLGYIVFPNYILVRKRVVGNLKTKLYLANRIYKVSDKRFVEKTLAMLNSYYGHFSKANSYNLRKDIYQKHLNNYKNNLRPVENLSFFRPRKPAR